MDYLNLDKDIFYSIINMKLRDFYQNLEDFCKSEGIDEEELNNKLKEYGLSYNIDSNQIR